MLGQVLCREEKSVFVIATANNISLLLNNYNLQKKLKNQGPERAKKFSWDNTIDETLKAYERVYEFWFDWYNLLYEKYLFLFGNYSIVFMKNIVSDLDWN